MMVVKNNAQRERHKERWEYGMYICFYDFLMISSAHRSKKNFLFNAQLRLAYFRYFLYLFFSYIHRLIFFLFLSFFVQLSIADDVEVVKSVSPDEVEKREENTDQVALESVEEAKVHAPPPHVVSQG